MAYTDTDIDQDSIDDLKQKLGLLSQAQPQVTGPAKAVAPKGAGVKNGIQTKLTTGVSPSDTSTPYVRDEENEYNADRRNLGPFHIPQGQEAPQLQMQPLSTVPVASNNLAPVNPNEPAEGSTLTLPKLASSDPRGQLYINQADRLAAGHPAVQDLYKKAQGIKNPFLRGLGEVGAKAAQIGEGIGSALPFVNTALSAVPGTRLNYNLQRQLANNNLNNFLGQEKTAAETNLSNVEADTLPDKTNTDKYAIATQYSGPKGEPVTFNPKTNALSYKDDKGQEQTAGIQRYEKDAWAPIPNAVDSSGNSVERNAVTGQVRPIQGVKPFRSNVDHYTPNNDYQGPHGEPTIFDPEKQQFFYTDKNTGQRGIDVHRFIAPKEPTPTQFYTPDGKGGFTVSTTPTEKSLTASGINTGNSPTTAEKTRSGIVTDTVKSLGDITSGIDSLAKDELGPRHGTINEALMNHPTLQGLIKVNPKVADLASQIELLKTGVGMAHFGVRGGPVDFRKTQDAYYSLAQDPKVLKAHIAGGLNYLKNYLNDHDANRLKEDDVYSKLPPEMGGTGPASSDSGSNSGRPAGATHTGTVNGVEYYTDKDGNVLGEVPKKK